MSLSSWAAVMLLPLACALLANVANVASVPAPVPAPAPLVRVGARQRPLTPTSSVLPLNGIFRRLPILDRLIANATLIRQTIVDNFSCGGKKYGFYADQENGCQVFHVCLDYQQLFPRNFSRPLVAQYSFICPKHTIFSQEALVCAWKESAFPCEMADQMYSRNDIFFKQEPEDEGFGRRVPPVTKVKGGTVVEVFPPPPPPSSAAASPSPSLSQEDEPAPPKRERVPLQP